MNKSAIEKFAIWARKKLISEITYKAGLLGITEKGIAEPLPQSAKDMQLFDVGTKNYTEVTGAAIGQRAALVAEIRSRERSADYKTAFSAVVEEVAYTWFNRMIAIRFMEVNSYLPSRIRVLSSENPAKNEPDFVTTPFETDLPFTAEEREVVLRYKDENKLDELFRMLFIKQCNKLHEILPELFETTSDYTELLLNISFTDKDDVVYRLTHDIEEKYFDVEKEGQVEIIGWLYQYYNSELKDETFAQLKKNVKITKERIPAATQLFTPDWIVRYMVENSLGRIFIDKRKNEGVFADGRGLDEMTWAEVEAKRIANEEYIAEQMGWKYFLPEAEQTPEVQAQLQGIQSEYAVLSPEDIKIMDPCMGSGHILVYAFDVLMQIYESQGYTQRDAARSIITNNLYGLDIDKRAYQLAYFAVMMKARQYNRRILTENIQLNLFVVDDSSALTAAAMNYIANGDKKLRADLQSIKDDLVDAKEYGSLVNVTPVDFDAIDRRMEEIKNEPISIDSLYVREHLPRLLQQAKVMAQKCHVVVTNPPYMAVSNASGKMQEYVKKNFSDSKSDLFAVFIEKCGQLATKNGYQAMITQHAWMFLSSFEKLRTKLQMVDTINMAHLGARAFEEIGGEVVQTTSFVMRKSHIKDYKGTYCRLIEPTTQQGKEDMFLAGENRYTAQQDNFSKIPGSPVAYWVPLYVISLFAKMPKLGELCISKTGMTTGDNGQFLRDWYEVRAIDIKNRWAFYNKGGGYRKWYGNIQNVIIWENDGALVKGAKCSTIRNPSFYFKKCISWNLITTDKISVRSMEPIFVMGDAGPACYINSDGKYWDYLALLNSVVSDYLLKIINPTINYSCGVMESFPVCDEEIQKNETIGLLAKENVSLSSVDWDSYETSWEFRSHPLVRGASTVAEAYAAWEQECDERFNTLKANEEELNRIFIDIYGLQDELTPEVDDKDVTVRKADLKRDIRSLISYAVGCMFGRYSLDVEGLAYAGGEWDSSKYRTFQPDADNVLPICDDGYFQDDIVGRFVQWVDVVYGHDTLEENLKFIADALGNKGNSSVEVIRNYFLNDFYADHCKTYQKRPIYWLFDSGKQNGFKALVYMHHWNVDTTGNLRVEYLHKMQRVYEREIDRMQEIIDTGTDSREIAAATKRKNKLTKQLKETKDYDTKIGHLALARIDIDLDDGVKVNYEKVQTGTDGQKLEILAKLK